MFFAINPSAAIPIYRQIVDQVRRMVASGQLEPGSELPSVRSVAAEHAINPMTVSKAYSLMEAEGLLVRQRGLGMVVAPRQPARSLTQRIELLRPSVQAAAEHARQLEVPLRDVLALFKDEFDGGS